MSTPSSSPNCYVEADEVRPEADRADDSVRATTGNTDDDWAELVARWRELREFASFYIAANVDRLQLKSRTVVMWSILGIVVGVIAVSVVVTASVLFVVSLGQGIGQLLNGRIWLGQLLVSAVILAAAAGGLLLAIRRRLRKYHEAIVNKYETRKQQERAEHGTDVEQRAKKRADTDL